MAAILLSSCMVGPNYVTPKAGVEGRWVDGRSVSPKPYGVADVYWWRNFKDPVLDDLIETAYRHNLSLQQAGVRILQARAQLNGAIGNLFPQQQALGGALNYYYINEINIDPGAELNNSSLIGPALQRLNRQFGGLQIGPNLLTDQVLFSASWEIDFWGKYRRQIQSDRATFLSSVAAYDDALVTLIGDVANTYINIRTLQRQLRIYEENMATQAESLRIAKARFNAGETSELDVSQAETQLARTEASIPGVMNSLNQAMNALAVLLGETPAGVRRRFTKAGKIPVPPAKVAAGIPRDLLRRRPDVRQAGLQAASQSALIGVAVANMLPAFSLNGTFGYSSSNAGDQSLLDLFNWQNALVKAGSSFIFPIFNYGRLINRVRVQDASFQEAILNYQNTVLIAQQEVENGLSAFTNGKRSVASLEKAVTWARRTTKLALVQYKEGQTDYTTVLTAEQAQLNTESSLASAQGDVVNGIISVYRALGGGWQIRSAGDVISDDVKAAMARRTNWGRMLERSRHLPAVAPEDQPVANPKMKKPIAQD